MTPSSYSLTMVRGDTFKFDLDLSGIDGEITGVAFSIKKRDRDTEVLISKTLGNGIEEVKEGSGVYRVRVAPEDTRGFVGLHYIYDVQLTIGEDVVTPLKGDLTVVHDVTPN